MKRSIISVFAIFVTLVYFFGCSDFSSNYLLITEDNITYKVESGYIRNSTYTIAKNKISNWTELNYSNTASLRKYLYKNSMSDIEAKLAKLDKSDIEIKKIATDEFSIKTNQMTTDEIKKIATDEFSIKTNQMTTDEIRWNFLSKGLSNYETECRIKLIKEIGNDIFFVHSYTNDGRELWQWIYITKI